MRFRRTPYLKLIVTVLLLAGAGLAAAGEAGSTDSAVTPPKDPRFKNVIIMICDGCGMNTIKAGDLYLYGEAGKAVYEQFPVKAMMSTYPAGGGYDAQQAREDYLYAKKGATDSAAAATAIATGVKTYDGAIGVDPNKAPVKNVIERAEELGKSTGVVTSVPFSHATPASFVAHNESRGNYVAIAVEMMEKSPADVIMGCGHPLYTEDGKTGFNADSNKDDVPDYNDYKYAGGKESWEKLVSGTAGASVDADHNGRLDDAWTLVQTRDEFRALTEGPTPKRVFGVAQVSDTLQEGRSGHDPNVKDDAPYEVAFTPAVPSLEEMTAAALNVLDDNSNGFFLIVEGGAVDWANHANQLGRAIEELAEFNKAVEAVCAWVSSNSDWNETVLVVTADHETGYLTAAGKDASAQPRHFDDLTAVPRGSMPAMKYNSGSHTNLLVPFFAKGSAATVFLEGPHGEDPVCGRYIDNTAIAKSIFEAWK